MERSPALARGRRGPEAADQPTRFDTTSFLPTSTNDFLAKSEGAGTLLANCDQCVREPIARLNTEE
jgi:hypothetical protein